MGITLPMLLPGKISKKTSSLGFQTDETKFDKEGKWNIVSDEMEKKFETFYIVSKELLMKACPMTSMVLRPLNIRQNETLKHDKEDRDTSTTRQKD